MKKTTLLTNLKYIAIGTALAFSISVVHGAFALPSAGAPGSNIAVPIHAEDNQVKNGSLSVGSISVVGDALFNQQTFLSGVVRGGLPTSSSANSTVVFGDTAAPTDITASGNVSAHAFLKSRAIANTSDGALCANATGGIYLCNVTPTPPPAPKFGITGVAGPITNPDGSAYQIFQIEDSVATGDTFTFEIYGVRLNIKAGASDNVFTITKKLTDYVNNNNVWNWCGLQPSNKPEPKAEIVSAGAIKTTVHVGFTIARAAHNGPSGGTSTNCPPIDEEDEIENPPPGPRPTRPKPPIDEAPLS